MNKLYFFILSFLLSLFLSVGYTQNHTTYKSNGTTYYSNDTYKTTGKPKVKRSNTAKKEFLESKGYNKVPSGYQVDHKTPLSQGGSDKPENMQLITTQEHKTKTANERKAVSNSTYSKPSYNSNSTYSAPNYKSTTTYNSNTTRQVYTGSKGGQYYYNSNGKRSYIKRK